MKGRVAALNFYPPPSDARSDFWLATTGGARLMTNALLFGVAGGNQGDRLTTAAACRKRLRRAARPGLGS